MDTFMLEHLLKEKRDINNPLKDYPITHLQKNACSSVSDQQADKSADLDDFVRMVEKIITKSGEGKKLGIEFVPDEGSRKYADQSFEIKHPYVFFNVISATPTNQLKPRVRRVFVEEPDKNASRSGMVMGQTFEALIQFNIFACDYLEATKVMKFVEDMLFSYTAYFVQNGIAELIFHKRLTDQNLDLFRQKSSIRSLQYYIRYERNLVTYDQMLAGVSIK